MQPAHARGEPGRPVQRVPQCTRNRPRCQSHEKHLAHPWPLTPASPQPLSPLTSGYPVAYQSPSRTVDADRKGRGLPEASTATMVIVAAVTGTIAPVANRSASTSMRTVTLVVPSRVVWA